VTETKLEAAVLLPAAGFRFEEVSGPTLSGRTTTWKRERAPSVAGWFARLMNLGRRRSRVRAEAQLRRCGHPGVLADYLSAKSRMR
jgi:hypothetical protein